MSQVIRNPIVLAAINNSRSRARGASPAAKNEVSSPINPVRQFSQTLPQGIVFLPAGGGRLVRKSSNN